MVKNNIADILAYDLIPLEEQRQLDDGNIEYDHGYLVKFTPAYTLDRQYVTWKSVLSIIVFTVGFLSTLGIFISQIIG